MTKDAMADSADPSARFDRVEKLIALYPDITEEELAVLKRWFAKEASAFEAASIASKQPDAYSRFKADHIDRFNDVELTLCVAVACALACALAAAIYLFM